MAVSYGIAEFVTGRVITSDLPVLPGASWDVALNTADILSCSISVRSAEVRALDPWSITEPLKHVLYAESEAGDILAWGVIQPDREYDADTRKININAIGGWSFFDALAILPASAASAQLSTGGVPDKSLDTNLTGSNLSGIAARLIAQALTWPGAPKVFGVPANQSGNAVRQYAAVDLKSVGDALTELTEVENGPDIAFDARYREAGRFIEYPIRIGRGSNPLLGLDVGQWYAGGEESPVTELVLSDLDSLATDVFMVAGKSESTVLSSHRTNRDLTTTAGYPPRHLIDTSRSSVELQSTLDGYANENRVYASKVGHSLSFSVRADATPPLGQYRPGDTVTVVVSDSGDDRDPILAGKAYTVRITGFGGDEVARSVPIQCTIIAERAV